MLASKTVAVLEGFASTQFIEINYPDLNLYYVKNVEEALVILKKMIENNTLFGD